MHNSTEIIQKEVEHFTKQHGLSDIPVNEIAQKVLDNIVYWEMPVADGKKLILFRFFSPVIMRDEVFLGSVLLNSFISKQILFAVQENNLGTIATIANDLENYFYLWITDESIGLLKDIYVCQVEKNLPDLFFGEHDESKGIYGTFKNLMGFESNNYGSFPADPIPQAHCPLLWKAGLQTLKNMSNVSDVDFQKNIDAVIASMAFYLSKDGTESQSQYKLLARTVTQYDIVNPAEVMQAFNFEDEGQCADEKKLTENIKNNLKQSKNSNSVLYSTDKLRSLILKILTEYDHKAETDPENWMMKFNRDKLLKFSSNELATTILENAQLGFFYFDALPKETLINCRCCGRGGAILKDRQIIMGENVSRFHNQSVRFKQNKGTDKICIVCSLQSYLATKLLSSIQVGAIAVPQLQNIVFHYGRHSDDEVKAIAKTLKQTYMSIRDRKSLKKDIWRVQERIEELNKKINDVKSEKKKNEYKGDLLMQEKQREQLENQIKENFDGFDLPFEYNPDVDPISDILYNTQLDVEAAENYVFGLGIGGYRLIAFILPEIRHINLKKSHDFAQKRFNNSKVSVLTLLSFLRKVCGCNGPYYFLTLPTLTEDAFSFNHFYVRNERFDTDYVLNYYELLTGIAKQVIKPNKGEIPIVKWMLLAERLNEDPMVTFSKIMRDSGFAGDEQKYKRLSIQINPILGGLDIIPYVKAYQKLYKQLASKGGT